ncbi:MAG: general secretion pathway protein GspK [Desulfamplus sp.]|nr:general secretion pathway protein GspK [Desulfamplus sp.]
MVIFNNKGMALLITLALIAVLMTAALELVRNSGDSAELERKITDRLQAQEMARSGIELAMFILTRDAEQNDIDSLQEMWASPYVVASAVELLGFDQNQGSLDVVITDELGKIQVNALLEQFPGNIANNDQIALWERFLNIAISSDKSLDLRDPAEIINSLKDWLDSGDDDAISGLSGAESDYYEALDPPIFCSNGPLNSVEELFMIKGIPKNITSIPAKLIEKSIVNLPDSATYKPFGLNNSPTKNSNIESKSDMISDTLSEEYLTLEPDRIFTVYGIDSNKKEGSKFAYSGKININTADVAVLAAMLPIGMEDQASELANFRIEKGENRDIFTNSLDSGWYKKVISLSPKDAKAFEKIVRYSSDLFRVDATANVNGVDASLTGFIKREKRGKSGKWGCTIIQLTGN